METLDKIKELIKREELFLDNEKIVVGVSGGADSICLLLILTMFNIRLLAVHINHGLRGEEALRDENFVRDFCKKKNIPLITEGVDVRNYAVKNKLSEEEAGRILRYEIFNRICVEEQADKIAVAHNKNDVAETLIINMVRGADLRGLSSIRAKNRNIIRPLIETERREIEELLSAFGEKFVTDSSNLSNIYTRNLVRNKILKELETINPATVEHIFSTSRKLLLATDFVEREAKKLYKCYVVKKAEYYLLKNELADIDKILVDEIIYMILGDIAGTKKNIASVHIELVRKLFEKEVSKQLSLPYGITARRGYEGLFLYKFWEKKEKKEAKLKIEKLDSALDLTLVKKLNSSACIRYFACDRMKGNIVLRTRKSGDYIVISKDGKKKKLKDYFIDCKIPREERDTVLLVAIDNEILWVVGHRRSENFRITEETKQVLRIEIIFGGEDDVY